jgi:hypothetical protein
MNTLLNTINDPADLRRVPRQQLHTVADELRAHVLNSVSRTGGHLSSNLGTVELTIALHYVFNTPEDRIIWDVGHQSYPHKILTGRRDRMHTLRQAGGLSGCPRRSESEYDTFGTAHSSTSISAALGMAMAARIKGEWIDVYKDPITDPGKQSKRGRLTLIRHTEFGSWKTVPVPHEIERIQDMTLPAGWAHAMETVWEDGALTREWTLDEVRARAARGL